MDSQALQEARDLVATSVKVQARSSGLWQHHGGLRWWQSGLPAMAANLVVDAGPQPHSARVLALAELLVRAGSPAGWLVWPDQLPKLQGQWLSARGFTACERLWLATLCSNAPSAALLLEASPAVPRGDAIRWLGSPDVEGLAQLYGRCHGIPDSLASVTAHAFVTQSHQLSTLAAFCLDPSGLAAAPVASITACIANASSAQDAAPVGGLVWLGTHPAWRRRGYARSLTALACRWLLARGVDRIHVQAAPAAQALYRSLGFVDQGWLELWGWQP
jgi:ribosomal protein S18 acetylase RimI-like enzyme